MWSKTEVSFQSRLSYRGSCDLFKVHTNYILVHPFPSKATKCGVELKCVVPIQVHLTRILILMGIHVCKTHGNYILWHSITIHVVDNQSASFQSRFVSSGF